MSVQTIPNPVHRIERMAIPIDLAVQLVMDSFLASREAAWELVTSVVFGSHIELDRSHTITRRGHGFMLEVKP